MNKYIIELSSKYSHISSKPVEVSANTAQDAIDSFFSKKGLYYNTKETEFSDADVRVTFTGNQESWFYKVVNKESIEIERPTAVENADIIAVDRLLSQKKIIVYHGTKNASLKPDFNYDNKNNDYGKGFYTTPDAELGKEWAYATYTRGEKGYLYKYTVDLAELRVLNLTKKNAVHWIAELITNRSLNIEGREALQDTVNLFRKKYKLDTSNADVIIGYRADDSYFTYAEDFLNGAIYLDTLESALRNGKLGIQIFFKSQKAFEALKQVGDPEEVSEVYKDKYEKRDINARNKYRMDKANQVSRNKIRVFDLL